MVLKCEFAEKAKNNHLEINFLEISVGITSSDIKIVKQMQSMSQQKKEDEWVVCLVDWNEFSSIF